MKHLRTAPTETGFFETYAKLAKSITLSGVFAQVVSALTEIGGIFAASYSALLPIFPQLALPFAAAVAIIGTAVLELGLRVLMPYSVDAVLYRRFSGLHLVITVVTWGLTVVLLTASGLLSFQNSKTIVAEYSPEAEQITTTQADSIYQAAIARHSATWQADSARIAGQYAAQITAATTAGAGKVEAAKRELSNIYNKEKRTGQSYATQKDKARQLIADREAEAAEQIAGLQAAQATATEEARQRYREGIAKAEEAHGAATGEIKQTNQAASNERAATVAAYGLGLGWFTIVCLLIFSAAVILERIHAKGSGITEKVELSQYDLNPAAWVEAWQAFRDRVQYNVRSRIQAFAERTPPPPVPTPAAELYDPTQLANLAATLKIELEREAEDADVIYLPRKRRMIGFKHGRTERRTHETSEGSTHESKAEKDGISRAIKGTPTATHETPELRQLKQRLKDYKKRLGKHQQKAKTQERTKGEATRRTLEAIENNRHWVEHYTELLNQAEAAAKGRK